MGRAGLAHGRTPHLIGIAMLQLLQELVMVSGDFIQLLGYD
jgi:hypothetical protein